MSRHNIINARYTDTPLVFGHRGASAYAPMNTLPAFDLAALQGAHGIELDVHCSRDGHPVIIHDFTVDATTNGSGRVADLSLNDLKALDAGSWFGPAFAGVRIPTLDEVFETVGRHMFVNIEMKPDDAAAHRLEKAVAACITRHQMQQRVLVSSFHPPTLARFRAVLPEVPLGYLYQGTAVMLPPDAVYEAYHPYHSLVTPRLIEECLQHNQVLNVWTLNDPARAIELYDLGVHGFITDVPDILRNALE